MRKLVLGLISLTCAIWMSILSPSAVLADAGSTAGDLYVKGGKTFQFGSGLLFSPLLFGTDRPEFNYSMSFVRAGYFLTETTEKKYIPRGNLEGIMQLSGSAVTDGPGNFMVEYALLVRYNVVYPDWKIVPYFQVGAGILYNDVYKDHTQTLIGQSIEFSPQGSVGFRYLMGKRWSLDLEGIFHHISNAGLAQRNMGSNAFGGFIGLSYFFGPSAK